ncbi:hypothetical protein Lalb_Chr07g0192851 [Lupinus albus]|uniref:Uncharacterized protein n=1 Tax=Lupinus albus TaxID=3870 RepID=A0A6A4Q9T7_LUPAL|nr:hypothetical protein Lalb_Chr07g0192851 [Lupinus albus]
MYKNKQTKKTQKSCLPLTVGSRRGCFPPSNNVTYLRTFLASSPLPTTTVVPRRPSNRNRTGGEPVTGSYRMSTMILHAPSPCSICFQAPPVASRRRQWPPGRSYGSCSPHGVCSLFLDIAIWFLTFFNFQLSIYVG